MAIAIDWGGTKIIDIPQADLTFLSGTLYELDSVAFWNAIKLLEDSEGMPWPDVQSHNPSVTILGIVYADAFLIVNGYSIRFENTGSDYTINIVGSNNNFHDVDGGILVPTPGVTVVPGNSAGLISADALLTEIERARKILTNRQELVSTGTDVRIRTWDDDGVTVLEENVLTDPNDNDPSLDAGAATKRGVSQ